MRLVVSVGCLDTVGWVVVSSGGVMMIKVCTFPECWTACRLGRQVLPLPPGGGGCVALRGGQLLCILLG